MNKLPKAIKEFWNEVDTIHKSHNHAATIILLTHTHSPVRKLIEAAEEISHSYNATTLEKMKEIVAELKID